MSILDIIIIAVLVFFLIKGIIRGFIREFASLIGVILGIVLGIRLQPELIRLLQRHLPPGGYLSVVAFSLLFFASIIGCNLIGWGTRVLIRKGPLGGLDRVVGGCFALIKGIIITYLALILITFFLPGQIPLISKSKLAPLIIRSYQDIVRFIPVEFSKKIKDRWERSKNEWLKKDGRK